MRWTIVYQKSYQILSSMVPRRTNINRECSASDNGCFNGSYKCFGELTLKSSLKESINYFAGHSLGEYTALAAANSLSISDVAKILFFRGQSMQSSTIKIKSAMAPFMGADIK